MHAPCQRALVPLIGTQHDYLFWGEGCLHEDDWPRQAYKNVHLDNRHTVVHWNYSCLLPANTGYGFVPKTSILSRESHPDTTDLCLSCTPPPPSPRMLEDVRAHLSNFSAMLSAAVGYSMKRSSWACGVRAMKGDTAIV